MANRTPGLQFRSLYHSYWGIYGDGSTLLPNQSANPLTSPGEFDKLEEGDLGYSNEPGNEGLYVCTDPGGAAATPPATWVMLAAGGAVVQTIRDAHQIVVGQDTLAPYSDVVAIDADFVDDGSGVQLQAALTAASALIVGSRTGVDVRLRPCSIGPAAPLTMGANIKLIGADRDACTLTVNAGGVLIADGTNNVIESITFENQGDGAQEGLIVMGAAIGAEVRRCRFSSDNSAAVNTLSAIWVDIGTYDLLVEDNEFELNTIINAAGDRVGIALTISSAELRGVGAIRFNNNRVFFGDMVRISVGQAFEGANPIQVSQNIHSQAGTPGVNSAPIKIEFEAPPPSPGQVVFPGPEIMGNSVRMSDASWVGSTPDAIVFFGMTPANQRSVRDAKVVGNTLVGSPASEAGVQLLNDSTSAPQFSGVLVSGNVIRVDGADGNVEIAQSNVGFAGVEAAQHVVVTGNCLFGGTSGLVLSKSAGPGNGIIQKGTFTGNSGDIGQLVQSNNADNNDFTIVSNSCDGTTVIDPSGTFEVAHNL